MLYKMKTLRLNHQSTAGGSDEMGDPRQCEGRPRCLSLAHSHVCRSRCGVPVRSSWNEQELRIAIDKRANEPGTGNAVDLHIGAGHPFHRCLRRLTDD